MISRNIAACITVCSQVPSHNFPSGGMHQSEAFPESGLVQLYITEQFARVAKINTITEEDDDEMTYVIEKMTTKFICNRRPVLTTAFFIGYFPFGSETDSCPQHVLRVKCTWNKMESWNLRCHWQWMIYVSMSRALNTKNGEEWKTKYAVAVQREFKALENNCSLKKWWKVAYLKQLEWLFSTIASRETPLDEIRNSFKSCFVKLLQTEQDGDICTSLKQQSPLDYLRQQSFPHIPL